MVLATAVPDKAPTRSKMAAMATAWVGVRTLVPTEVAMALAVSWKPLIYSKTMATRSKTRIKLIRDPCSGMFQDDMEDDVTSITAAIEDFFKQFQEIFHDYHAHGA